MMELLIAVSIVVLFAGVVYGVERARKRKQTAVSIAPVQEVRQKQTECAEKLECRVTFGGEQGGGEAEEWVVEIRGTVRGPADGHAITVKVSVADTSEEAEEPQIVYRQDKSRKKGELTPFVYSADMGKLPRQETVLTEWVCVGRMQPGWLLFPRKGQRRLAIAVSVLSRNSGEELASGQCQCEYSNPEFGYIDLEENSERTKTLAVPLAFAVSAADNNFPDCQVELIKNWARSNIDSLTASSAARRKLEKALKQTVAFFREGHRLDVRQICEELVRIAVMGERYEILDLCMRVAGADGHVDREELELLKDLSIWLEVDQDRFHEMAESILPASMHDVEDMDFILGVNSSMSAEEARKRLNKEYRKWNSRVTSPDPKIQNQADHMLNLIAEARAECIG